MTLTLADRAAIDEALAAQVWPEPTAALRAKLNSLLRHADSHAVTAEAATSGGGVGIQHHHRVA